MKKRELTAVLVLVLGLSGCGWSKKKGVTANKKAAFSNVNIPLNDEITVADDTLRSFFDQDINEFVPENAHAQAGSATDGHNSDFAWVDATDSDSRKVYFDFDRYSVRKDQQENVVYDVDLAKKKVVAPKHDDKVVVLEGHSCHSAGSKVYNLALSEKRAKAVADRFVAAGIPQETIKVVGRGQEVPVTTGTRDEQWKNRRVEMHVVNA